MQNEIPIAALTKIVLPKEKGKSIKLYVMCPYCNKEHQHGGGDNLSELSSFLSIRLSHCISDKQYVIKEVYNEPSMRKSYNADYIREYHRKYYHNKIKQSS